MRAPSARTSTLFEPRPKEYGRANEPSSSTRRGMGTRMGRFSMLVDNGVVKQLNVEGPGKFEVSDAGTMLKQLG